MTLDATNSLPSIVLDLPGFRVLAAAEYGGEREVLVETLETEVECERCGRRAAAHARREHLVRDLEAAGRPVVLVRHKRIWRCRAARTPARGLDAFHVVKLGFTAVDDVRRRVQQQQLGHRGHKGDPLYGVRRLLRRRADRLADKHITRLNTALTAGDPNLEVTARPGWWPSNSRWPTPPPTPTWAGSVPLR